MRLPLAVATAALLALAGCEDGTPPQDTKHIKVANPHSDQLAALPADLQRLGLMRAIRDNGKRCRRVEAGRFQQDYEQLAMWVAMCSDGRHWAIFIAPNADTQVRGCDEMRQLGLPQCRPITPPAAADPNANRL